MGIMGIGWHLWISRHTSVGWLQLATAPEPSGRLVQDYATYANSCARGTRRTYVVTGCGFQKILSNDGCVRRNAAGGLYKWESKILLRSALETRSGGASDTSSTYTVDRPSANQTC